MPAHRNKIIARRLWDAIANTDVPTLRALLSEKAVWRMPGNSPLAGSYRGADAIFQFMARVGELTSDLESELIDIYVSDEGAVLRYSVHAVRGLQELDTEHLFVVRISDDRIADAVFTPLDPLEYDRFFTPH